MVVMKIASRSPENALTYRRLRQSRTMCMPRQPDQSRKRFIRAIEYALFQKVMMVLALQIDATDHNC